MNLSKRIERLEGLRQPSEPDPAPLPNSEEFSQKFNRRRAEWDVEDKRRKTLPLEEQIELVKADREAARREGTTRVRNFEPPSLDGFRDRLAEIQISELEKKIRERDAIVR